MLNKVKMIVVCILLACCANGNTSEKKVEISEAVGMYIREKQQYKKELILEIKHIENDRYSYKSWYDGLALDDKVILIKNDLAYDLSETFKVGEFSQGFRKFKSGRDLFSRINNK